MKNKKLQKWLLTLATVAVAVICAGAVYTIARASSITITDIDYEKLTMTIKANDGDSRIFFATSKSASTWDEIPEEIGTDRKVTMDISWVSVSRDYPLYIKGDKSTEPVKVVLPKQNTKFKASLNTATNEFKFSNVGTSGKIYWRKSTSTEWEEFNQADQTSMQNLLESFSLKGISLVFCTSQKKGTSVDNPGERPSKISTVKVTKRAAAPNVSLNYNNMTFAVKKTMEYKLSDEDTWKNIDTTSLTMKEAMPSVLYESGKDMEEDETVGIDFRVKATTSKVASQTKTLMVPGQKDTPAENITPVYTGPSQLKILIEEKEIKKEDGSTEVLKAASTENPYEYTVVKSGDELNIYTAKWTGITTVSTKISSTEAPEGSAIYVRKKANGGKLPGKEQKIVASVKYIEASTLGTTEYALEKIQGVKTELTFAICVSSKEAEVSGITFNGTKAGFKASKAEEPTDGKYSITITINDTSAIESISDNLGKTLTAEITLNNTEVINKGVTLYIQKAATMDMKNYTVYADYGFIGGTGENGELIFDIALNKEKADELTNANVESISYNGKVINTDQYTATKSDTEHKITVTFPKVSIDALGKSGAGYVTLNKYGTAYSLVVNLKNGEKLENVKLTVKYPVIVDSNHSSFGISKSSYEAFLKELDNANQANSDNDATNNVPVPTTYTNPEITYTIQKDIYDLDSSYHLTSLTWNGDDKNVLAGVTETNGKFKVTVDLKKLVAAGTGSASLKMTLTNSDGENLVVDYGYQITVTD